MMGGSVDGYGEQVHNAVETFYVERGIADPPEPKIREPDGERCMPGEYDWRTGDPIVYTPRREPISHGGERGRSMTDGGTDVSPPAPLRDDLDALQARGVHETWHALFDEAHRVSAEKWQIYDCGPIEAVLSATENEYRAWLRDRGFKEWVAVQEEVQPDNVYDRLYRETRDRLERWAGPATAERYDRLARLRGIDEYLARTVGCWEREDTGRAPRAEWGAPGYLQYTLGHAAIHAVDGDALTAHVREEGLASVLAMETEALLDAFTRPI